MAIRKTWWSVEIRTMQEILAVLENHTNALAEKIEMGEDTDIDHIKYSDEHTRLINMALELVKYSS